MEYHELITDSEINLNNWDQYIWNMDGYRHIESYKDHFAAFSRHLFEGLFIFWLNDFRNRKTLQGSRGDPG